jgi:hypothetical protein
MSYVLLVFGTLVLLVVRGLVFALSAIDSSRALHAELFHNLLRAPTSTFFDVCATAAICHLPTPASFHLTLCCRSVDR